MVNIIEIQRLRSQDLEDRATQIEVNFISRHTILGMVLLSIMLSFFANLNAQNQTQADSAIYRLQNPDLSDSDKLENLYMASSNSTNPDNVILYSQKLIEHAEALNDHDNLILGYINLGAGHKLKGNLSKALESYFQAARLASKYRDPVAEGDAYTNIATVYTSNEDYKKALTYYNRVLELYENNVDSSRMAGIYINYGYATYKASLYDSSISLLKKAVYYANFASYNGYRAYAQSNMALALAKTGRFDEAENLLDSALTIMRSNKDHYGLSDCLIEIGGVYIEEGEVETGIEKLTKGYQIALDHGLKQQIQNGAKYLSKAYEKRGNLTKALDYQSKYYTYRDSLINAEQIRKLADLRTTYEVGKKQAEVDLLTEQRRLQRIITIAVASGALLMIVLLVVVYRSYRDKNKINKVLEDQKAQLESLNNTKDKFFSIVSHDLRGPVTAFRGISRLIKHAVDTKDHEELNEIADHIDKTALHLSGLLDNLLTWALQQQGHFPNVPEKLPLKEITDEIEGIFSAMAEGKDIRLNVAVEGHLVVWSDKNSTMTMIRNLVNNALKFTESGGEVGIVAAEDSGYAKIDVSDTGVGMEEEKLKDLFKMKGEKTAYGTAGEKGLGLGLQLVYEFVEMNNGAISVKSKKGEGTTFTIKLPLFESTQQAVNS